MEALEKGIKAPEFCGLNQDGKKICLSDFKGKNKVVLFFYPEDDTPGCTLEACNLRDNISGLKAKGYTVIGVSNDDVDSHGRFAKKFSLPFDLIADTDKSIVNAYGVYGEKNLYGHKFIGIRRTTFVVDEEGVISTVLRKVDTKDHTAQILKKEGITE
jgi:peroxiredoxin Q/BCP